MFKGAEWEGALDTVVGRQVQSSSRLLYETCMWYKVYVGVVNACGERSGERPWRGAMLRQLRSQAVGSVVEVQFHRTVDLALDQCADFTLRGCDGIL